MADPGLAAILTSEAFKEVEYFEARGLSFRHPNSYAPRLTSGNATPRTIYTNDRTGHCSFILYAKNFEPKSCIYPAKQTSDPFVKG